MREISSISRKVIAKREDEKNSNKFAKNVERKLFSPTLVIRGEGGGGGDKCIFAKGDWPSDK
jgi:hypothetical protein